MANINPSQDLPDQVFLENDNINELLKNMADYDLPYPDDTNKCRELFDFYAKEKESFIDSNDRLNRISKFLGIEKLTLASAHESVNNNSGHDNVHLTITSGYGQDDEKVEDNIVYSDGVKFLAEIPSPVSSLRGQNSIGDDAELDKTIRPNSSLISRETTFIVRENGEAPGAEGDQIPEKVDPLVLDPYYCAAFKPVIHHGLTPGIPVKACDRFLPSESQLLKTSDQMNKGLSDEIKKQRPVPLPRRAKPISFETESIISTDLKIDGSSGNLSLSPPAKFEPGAHSTSTSDIEANRTAVIPPVKPPASRPQRFTGAAAEEKIRRRQAESKD